MPTPSALARIWCRWLFPACLLVLAFSARVQGAVEEADDDNDDVTVMAPFTVNAAPVEEFGFRVNSNITFGLSGWDSTVTVSRVYPNTVAARAGLRPGDRILRTDGQSASVSLFSLSKWRKLMEKKSVAAAADKGAAWTLEVQSRDSNLPRTVKLSVPSPPPHWGAKPWVTPEGRAPVTVPEPGPLAALARTILENGVWTTHPDDWKALGYDWTLTTRDGARHRIFVSRDRGRTEIILSRSLRGKYRYTFVTSPSGALQEARTSGDKERELPLDQARAAFEQEIGFWLKDVERVTGRWPFEVSNPALAVVPIAGAAPRAPAEALAKAGNLAKPPDSFLKLPKATTAQRELFTDALAKLGADEDRWAYTETSRGLDDKHVTVTRFDPSKTGEARATLLKLDGKPPTPAAVKKWRDEGRDAPATLSELPPLRDLVDLEDVRVFAEETAGVVFELPLRSGNKDFPADKFQALFRVNKTHRGFEDFSVKLRESFRVAGVVKVTDAGMEARFQTLDPAYSPQPVLLKAGGAVRVLLVKFGRSFEATRQDYQRVEPAP